MQNTIKLFDKQETTAYPAGTIIFPEGSEGHEFFVVVEGEVDIIQRDTVLFTTGPGGIFGEMALIDQSPRSASAVAKTDCKLVSVDEKRFLFMVQQTPFFSLTVMRIMAERLRRLGNQIASKT